MGHYALLNNDNFVDQVITGSDSNDIIFETLYGDFHNCIANRKNYTGIGYYYDEQRDAFIPPKPFPSWILNEESCLWDSPVPYPNNGKMYEWNEDILNWQEINF